jgi:hypothetical protein
MSSIITSNIDETYPVPGQDNNSQGFRDNFNNIKIGIAQAKVEIEALETNTAKLNSNNDFNGFLLTNSKTNQFWGSYVNKGSNSASVTISVEDADLQTVNFTNTPRNSITFRNDGDRVGIGSLYHWSRTDNSTGFLEIERILLHVDPHLHIYYKELLFH